MPNKLTLIGGFLLFSGAIDAAIAYFFLPQEVRIYLYGAGALSAVIGLLLLLKGLASPTH